jgi:uncharacterized protein (TIGR02117 family)
VRIRNARVTKLVARTALALAALLAGYGIAGLIGGAIPANAGWRAPAAGVVVFVESNGIHTGIVVPKVAAGIDWRGTFPARDLADPRYGAYDHLAIGWGDRHFYLETPTWGDVRPATVLAAAVGSRRTLVHVEHVPSPAEAPEVRRIVLRPDEYRRLAAYIRGLVASGDDHVRGYAGYDAFYASTGRYSAVETCNAWTGDALRAAGVRVGAWTPFPNTVLWWLPAAHSRPAT